MKSFKHFCSDLAYLEATNAKLIDKSETKNKKVFGATDLVVTGYHFKKIQNLKLTSIDSEQPFTPSLLSCE